MRKDPPSPFYFIFYCHADDTGVLLLSPSFWLKTASLTGFSLFAALLVFAILYVLKGWTRLARSAIWSSVKRRGGGDRECSTYCFMELAH